MLDGEIVCLDRRGKTQFRDLLFRRGEPRFYAFDLLWCDGEDLRYPEATNEFPKQLERGLPNTSRRFLP